MSKHNFKDSLAKGAAGEAAILKLLPGLQKLDGRRSDFLVVGEMQFESGSELVTVHPGEKLELKTDSYPMSTGNFFIEYLSDIDRYRPGGPWQASDHGSDWWLYYYPQGKQAFLFRTVPLVEFLTEKLEESKTTWKQVEIPNHSWTTLGFKVPRTELSHLYTILTWE